MLLKLDVQCQWFYLLQVPSTEISVTASKTVDWNDGGCCLPLTGKVRLAISSLPNIPVDVHSSLGYHGRPYVQVHGFVSPSHAHCGSG